MKEYDSLESFLNHLHERILEYYPDDEKLIKGIDRAIKDIRKLRQIQTQAVEYTEIIDAMAEELLNRGYCPEPDAAKMDIITHFAAKVKAEA